MKRQLPARLRELREAMGLTREELSWASAIAVATIESIEQGRRSRPYYDVFLALAHGLGVSPAELDAPAHTPHLARPRGRPATKKKKRED